MALVSKCLDANRRSDACIAFEDSLNQVVVGQEEAKSAVVGLYQVFRGKLHDPARPVGSLLLLGPTGSGKTRIVEASAEILFHSPKAFLKVNCAEFQEKHEIAKLIGSPPGYLGHRETEPVITQAIIDRFQRDDCKLSFALFDEIEKAHAAVFDFLLGILDRGELRSGNGATVDMTHCMIFMTSNLGGREITERHSLGFNDPEDLTGDRRKEEIQAIAQKAASKHFSPEFMNRLSAVVVFHPLLREHLEKILHLELVAVQKRILESADIKFAFCTTLSAQDFLLKRGTSEKYGARHLRRAVEQYVVKPFSNLIDSGQIQSNTDVVVDHLRDAQELNFTQVKECISHSESGF